MITVKGATLASLRDGAYTPPLHCDHFPDQFGADLANGQERASRSRRPDSRIANVSGAKSEEPLEERAKPGEHTLLLLAVSATGRKPRDRR